MELHRSLSTRQLSVKDALGLCVADYNRTVATKRYRVDASKKKLILNLMRSPEAFHSILSKHYDSHRRSSSGLGKTQFIRRYALRAVLAIEPMLHTFHLHTFHLYAIACSMGPWRPFPIKEPVKIPKRASSSLEPAA